MDEWGWEQFRPWLNARAELPVGPMFCIVDGPNDSSATPTSARPRSTCKEIDPEEMIAAVHMRRAPMMSASGRLAPVEVLERPRYSASADMLDGLDGLGY
jgi:hypothetical protein